jgi:error-prone DNA polymerase
MVRRFQDYPDALQASVDIARMCTFDLGELAYQYPHERVIEGLTAQQALEQLATEAVEGMFDGNVPKSYRDQIAHELRLIGELGYAPYFLTVHSIVREARRRGSCAKGAARLPIRASASCSGSRRSIRSSMNCSSNASYRANGASPRYRHRF